MSPVFHPSLQLCTAPSLGLLADHPWLTAATRGHCAQVDDTEVINFLLSTEIIPLCLRTMEMGSELSKTVATFIVQKILLDDVGLNYICATAERFFAVGAVLGNMVRSWCQLWSTDQTLARLR